MLLEPEGQLAPVVTLQRAENRELVATDARNVVICSLCRDETIRKPTQRIVAARASRHVDLPQLVDVGDEQDERLAEFGPPVDRRLERACVR